MPACRKSERAWATGALLLGSLLSRAETAAAQANTDGEQLVQLGLSYSAPARCSTEQDFRERVGRSSTRLRWGDAGQPLRSYRVAIQETPTGFRGQLYEAGKAAPRVLDAEDCAELSDALALMLALSADPMLTADVPTAVTLEEEAPRPAKQQPRSSSRHLERERLVPVSLRPSGEAGDVASLSALAMLGAAPDILLGLALSYEGAVARLVSLRVEARAALARARANETYFGLTPAICLTLERSLAALIACGGVALGHLDVSAVEYTGWQSSYWIAPLLSVKLRSSVGRLLALELGAELERGFITRSYHVKFDDSTFETPVVTGVFHAGVGARF